MPRYVDMLKPADAEMYEQFRDDMGYKTANRFARECLRSYGKLKPRKQKSHWVNHYDNGAHVFGSSEYATGKGKPRHPLPVIPTQVIHGPDYVAIRHIWSYDRFSNRPLWSWYCHAGNYYGMCEDARRFDWPNF